MSSLTGAQLDLPRCLSKFSFQFRTRGPLNSRGRLTAVRCQFAGNFVLERLRFPAIQFGCENDCFEIIQAKSDFKNVGNFIMQ